MYDIIIRNGKIIDGTGANSFTADIGVKDMRIAVIGDLEGIEAAKVIDAEGKIVTPGFIDMHSHADQTILTYPKMESMLRQGITTFVGCQCGQSIAPIGKYWLGNQAEYDILAKLTPKLYPDMYDEDYYTMTEDTIPLVESDHGFKPDWRTFGQFLDRVDKYGTSGNIITLIGYSTIRMNATGPDGNRLLTEEEKSIIKAQINEAMESGAFGMSVGLDYKPGIFSKTDELMEMASELKKYDGIYFSHWRKTGLRAGTPKKQKKIDGIIETLEIGKKNDIQVQISHLSTGYDVFPANDTYMQVAAANRTLQVIDEYIEKGVKAHFDVIPNITGGTMIAPDLITLFKPWYKLTGGVSLFLENIKKCDYRKQICDHINSGKYFILNPLTAPDWDENINIIQCNNSVYMGKTIKQIADTHCKPSLEMIFDILIEDCETKIFRCTHSMNINAVQTYLNHPNASVGNDTFVFDLISTVGYDPNSPGNKPNPNTYCGFIKFITELGMSRIEDTIRKISGKPAEVLGLTDRGLIKEGYRADLLVIDIDNLRSNESVIEPRVYPEGIEYVTVNGKLVIDNGIHTGALPGGSIRRYNK